MLGNIKNLKKDELIGESPHRYQVKKYILPQNEKNNLNSYKGSGAKIK
ncbi:hypothetical protein [Bacillus cereus]